MTAEKEARAADTGTGQGKGLMTETGGIGLTDLNETGLTDTKTIAGLTDTESIVKVDLLEGCRLLLLDCSPILVTFLLVAIAILDRRLDRDLLGHQMQKIREAPRVGIMAALAVIEASAITKTMGIMEAQEVSPHQILIGTLAEEQLLRENPNLL